MNQPTEPDRPDRTPGDDRTDDDRRNQRPYVLDDPLVRFDARVLDPTTAVRLTNGEAPSPTVYVGDTLLVTADTVENARSLLTALDSVANQNRSAVRRIQEDPFDDNDDPDHDEFARLLRQAAESRLPLVFAVRFEPNTDGPAPAVDVWPLLQNIRQAASGDGADPEAVRLSEAIGLNHLMSAAADINGSPFSKGMAGIFGSPFSKGMANIFGNPFSKGMASGVASYAAAGSGGRGPVAVVMPPPLRSPENQRPHVVVADTGVGRHPWFDAQAVTAGLQIDVEGSPQWVGRDPGDPDAQRSDPEGSGAVSDPMSGLLDSHSGHGTFIAGLLRQACADADITAIRIMDSDGVVPELTLTRALTGLGVAQLTRQAEFDAIVLSLGYYSETADDKAYTAGLRLLILALSAMEVAVFCAAGNDSTQRRSYPAAFCEDPAFADGAHLAMASVAALNPDSTVALFSNDGEWVNAEAPGANLVSTAPVLAQGAWTSDTSFIGIKDARRGTVDPDSFVAGFSTWSGTSFAAPVLAGRYLARLAGEPVPRSVKARQPLLGLGRPGPAE
ncbi:S8 family serine peptidase [Nakamurella sp. GG22]